MNGTVLLLPPVHVALDAQSAAAYAALAALCFALTRRSAASGLAALILADPFEAARYIGPTTVTIPKVVLIAVGIGLIARRAPFAALRRRELRPLLAGAVATALVTLATAIPGTYIDAVARESLKALQFLATYAVAVVAAASLDAHANHMRAAGRRFEQPWWTLGVITAIVCASALVQEFAGAPSAVLLLGRTVPRIAGLLEGPNQLAGFLDIAVPLLAARALMRGGRPYVALVALALVTDVLTFSRAGLLAVVVGIVCVVVRLADRALLRPRNVFAASAAFAGLVVLLIRAGLVRASADDVDTASGLGSRAELWWAALGFWRAHPLLGIGAGNFELELPDVGLAGVRTHANSLYLQALAEGGVALFAATLFTLIAAVRTFFVKAPREALYAGVGAATVALALHQCFDFLTFFPKVGSFWWLWLGIASGTLVRAEPSA